MIKVRRNSQVASSRHAETAKDRRRPGRIDSVNLALIPLLRTPTADGPVAGDLAPVDRFKSLLAPAEVYAAGHYELHDATGSKFSLQTTCRSGDQLPYAPSGWFWLLADERTEAEKSQTMKVASVDAASLLGQAARCRRLAGSQTDGDINVTLLALAVEYELRAEPSGCGIAVSVRSEKPRGQGMTKAEATIRDAIRDAMTSTSELTGLRAGPVVDRLVDAILASLLDPLASSAIRELADTES